MKIRPDLAASFVIAAFLFVSSGACLILQPDLSMLLPVWEACLLINPLLILISFLTASKVSKKAAPFLAMDIIFCLAVLFLDQAVACNCCAGINA